MSTPEAPRGRRPHLTERQEKDLRDALRVHAETHPKKLAARYGISLSTVYNYRNKGQGHE